MRGTGTSRQMVTALRLAQKPILQVMPNHSFLSTSNSEAALRQASSPSSFHEDGVTAA